ncbi:hypothetical protein ASPZODRAFT_169816 [Penicilliopsis zonata CBS 506.65]|uniref:DNA repair protein rhp7 treble clef domain-containing protein n=1 Tax=Penicilliopsis zonata CBS 506.65 TaxID=1073090 RepID=A0A1L9S752_9EURO|nr:hypothetical protein ASPZODRAFT_169816 [Penicilliopsis zonata CBS 506.65]OJJ42995.1 hypothetical protein ASPZODRAFT_169816 [Penicilliopsis zonata CBS 506.65]
MAFRRQAGNQIRGPHSALTDFLASNNISAAQINEDYQQRLREAEEQQEQDTPGVEENNGNERTETTSETPEQRKKRKRKEAVALAKIKQSKEFARRKARRIGDLDDDDDDDDDDDELARDMMYEKSRPMPGQLENCEICSKRFTVTAYSKTGPNGGLLCGKCSKEINDEEKKSKQKKRGPKIGRRQNQSNLLDGLVTQGALSLVEMCTKVRSKMNRAMLPWLKHADFFSPQKVADNINDVEEFGDLPPLLLHRLSQILSKRRVITPRTLNLFLRPELDSIDIYDCAKLETDDFGKIFSFMPSVTNVNLRFAGQMKDAVVDYMVDHNLKIKKLYLDAANLVSDDCWRRLFNKLGPQFESLKLSNLDASFDDETVKELCKSCTSLRRLKLKHCWKTSDESLIAISKLPMLEHLSLNFIQKTHAEDIVGLVQSLGPGLRTLSLEGFDDADDEVLEKIHDNCSMLTKLRIIDNSLLTDAGFAGLFTNWSNCRLEYVDLSSTRDVDKTLPDGPEEAMGLASKGFVSLMQHSGSAIRTLKIASCRHISYAAFEQVFSPDKQYPHLKELDISFLTFVDDHLVHCIFHSCPALKKLIAFACFSVHDVRVPKGVALIGGLKAQGPIVLEGVHD